MILVAYVCLGVTVWAQPPVPVIELHVEGNESLPVAGILQASGLRTGAPASRSNLDRAANNLFQTGLFQSVNYRFQPKSAGPTQGYAVTFVVTEAAATRPVQLDIAGIDGEQIWRSLGSTNSLIGKQMPENEQAADYYQRAITSALRQLGRDDKLTLKSEADLATGRMTALFQAGDPPSLAALHFEGNHAIAEPALQGASARLVVGRAYSERELRQITDLNVKPLYEELGFLTLKIQSIRIQPAGGHAVAATIALDEGPVWRLGQVELVGEGLPQAPLRQAAALPSNQIANWKKVTAGLEAMKTVLHRDGYLGASCQPERKFRNDTGLVDLAIRVERGRRFHFGSLQLKGLSAEAEAASMKLWRLRTGDPMDTGYLDDYLRTVFKGPAKGATGLVRQLNARPGTEMIDVVIAFK